jgi:hemoglobin/transferrin/lactoferrin receptor protein
MENIETGDTGPLDTRYPDGGSDESSAAVYMNDVYTVNPHFQLQGGLRAAYHTLTSKFVDKTFFPFPYDEVSQSNVAITGSLGIVLQSDSGFRLSFIGATGFRTPSVDDMSKVFESRPGVIIVPNPDLGAEQTYNVELNLSKSFDNFQIGVGGYYTWYKNAITVAPGTFNGESEIIYAGDTSQVITNVNAKEAYIYGANAYLSWDFAKHLSLYSTINYTYGRIETDTTPYPLDHIPPVFGKTSLRYNAGKLNAEFSAIYHGWKNLEDYNLIGEDNFAYATADGMPSWMTLNLKASYDITKLLTVQAGIENIADANYRVFSSTISAPGRNLFVTLRAAW